MDTPTTPNPVWVLTLSGMPLAADAIESFAHDDGKFLAAVTRRGATYSLAAITKPTDAAAAAQDLARLLTHCRGGTIRIQRNESTDAAHQATYSARVVPPPA